MNFSGEQPKFEIKPTIEQKPFESSAVQSFFTKWCEINNSILPQMIGRDDWEQRGVKGILEKGQDGKQTLYIPKDLKLWEMIGVMEMVDHDTFATKPERQDQVKKKLLELGKTFQNAGVYITQRLSSIDQGKDIARALAEEFYSYGQSLMSGKNLKNNRLFDNIALHNLTASELDRMDRFLAGKNLYQSRQAKAEKVAADNPSQKNEFYESERQKTLSQFFRVSEKAFELSKPQKKPIGFRIKNSFEKIIETVTSREQKRQKEIEHSKSEAWSNYQKFLGRDKLSSVEQEEKENLERVIFTRRPWEFSTSIHSTFLTKVEKAMMQKIETPKRELEGSIFRRGMELLQRNMPFDTLPNGVKNLVLHWQNGETTLREALQIDKLKAELKTARQSGDTTIICAKEREIADKIQKAVGSFPHQSGANNPSEIVVSQSINCVGASMLGGALMREAELNYLVVNIPKHSILFLVTSDDQVEWRDMLSVSFNENLTDEMITGSKKDGSPLTVADVTAFSKNPMPEGLMFDISEKYRDKLYWVKEGQRQFVVVFEPEYGHQIQVLNNAGKALFVLGRTKEAIEAYRQAIAVDPKCAYPYYGLGRVLSDLDRNEETIEAYRQAIAVDPKYPYPYNGLGRVLCALNRNEEAIEAYRQAIVIDSKYAYPYNGLSDALRSLGRYEEATEAYKKFVDLSDKQEE